MLLHIDDNLLVFKRYDSKNAYITIVNNSDKELSLSFDNTAKSLIYGGGGKIHLLGCYSADVYYVKQNTTLEIN